MEDPDDPPYTGQVTAKQFQQVLADPQLGLSKLQLTSLLADAPFDDSVLDYFAFAPQCARTIDKLLDPSVMESKIDVLSRGLLSNDKLPGGKSESELARELNGLFDTYDVDRSGGLDAHEFAMALESLDLGLNRGEVDALLLVADEDGNGTIDRKEFMEFTFKHLLHLMKERHVKQLQEDVDRAAAGEDLKQLSEHGGPDLAAHAFDALIDTSLDEEQKHEMANLMEMFRRADKANQGYLTSVEFHRLLEALDLGLTQYQMARLMAEADENEDGFISRGRRAGRRFAATLGDGGAAAYDAATRPRRRGGGGAAAAAGQRCRKSWAWRGQ